MLSVREVCGEVGYLYHKLSNVLNPPPPLNLSHSLQLRTARTETDPRHPTHMSVQTTRKLILFNFTTLLLNGSR